MTTPPTLDSFAFIMTPLSLQFDAPVDLLPGHVLRRPNKMQLENIRPLVDAHTMHPTALYEYVFETEGGRQKPTPLPPESWHYHVIEYDSRQNFINELEKLFLITQPELRIGWKFQFVRGNYGKFSHIYPKFYNFYAENWIGDVPTEITSTDIEAYRRLLDIYDDVKPNYEMIDQILNRLDDLNGIPKRHDLHILGIFTLIEALIAHRPRATDIGDSLTHQVRTKIPLLADRFDLPLDYSRFKENAKPETVWARLYDLRSAIAHGGQADFSGKLQVLRGREVALSFLRQTVKALLRGALREPQLYEKLKQV